MSREGGQVRAAEAGRRARPTYTLIWEEPAKTGSTCIENDSQLRIILMIRRFSPIVLGVVALVATGCSTSSADDQGQSDRPQVVATTPQLVDFARQVGGEDIEVIEVLEAGVDPHDFEPTAADIETLATAEVIVHNGVGLEDWFAPTIESAGPEGEVVDASTGVKLRSATDAEDDGAHEDAHEHDAGDGAEDHGQEDGHEHGPNDPHIWQNPLNAKIMVENVSGALIEALPSQAQAIESRTTDYLAQLDELDAEIEEQMSQLDNKQLVTNHEAFGYFVDRYDMDYVGSVVPSFDSQAELSSAQINELVEEIKETETKAIFVESSLPANAAETIAREAGVEVISGDDSLYGDSVGPSGSYIDAMRHNSQVIFDNLS
jgi:zinc/manganese transport system substrate-binding protein